MIVPRACAALAAAVLLGSACTDGTPSADPTPSASPSPVSPSGAPSSSPSASPSVSVTATSVPTPTVPPAPACSVVRGSRAVDDSQHASVAFADASTGVVATGRRLYRSTDAGRTWRLAKALSGEAYDVVAAGCRTLFVVYAGSAGTHLDRSDDAGATWRRVVTNGTAFRALDFVTPRVGFAIEPFPDVVEGGRLWKTDDGGAHWRRIRQPGEAVFTVAAAANGVTLAGLNDGVARSSDGGATWTRVLTRPYRNGQCRVWLGANRSTAFALVEDEGPEATDSRLFRSENLASWTVVATAGDSRVGTSPGAIGGIGSVSLMVGRFDPDGVSVATTHDRGATFRRGMVVEPDEEGGDIVYGVGGIAWFDASRAVAVVGDDSAGVYRTTNAGATWTQVAFLDSP